MNSDHTTIWVTGGAGFIGSHCVGMLAKKYPAARMITLDKLTYAGNLKNLADMKARKNHFFFKGDIADENFITRMAKKYPPDYVVNCAAETHVDESIHKSAEPFVRANIDGVRALLEALRTAPRALKKFLQVSTDEVYGDLPYAGKKKFTEESPLHPHSPYAATKAAGDLLALAYCRTYGLPVVVTRSGNNFGPHQYPEKLIPYFISLAREAKPLPLYGDGKNVRDWIFVEDHCAALASCLFHGKSGEAYNIGAGNERANHSIAQLILRSCGRDLSLIRFVPDRPGHDRRYALDAGKIKRELGWEPKFSFDAALEKTIEWYKKNPTWMRHVRRKKPLVNSHIPDPSETVQKPYS